MCLEEVATHIIIVLVHHNWTEGIRNTHNFETTHCIIFMPTFLGMLEKKLEIRRSETLYLQMKSPPYNFLYSESSSTRWIENSGLVFFFRFLRVPKQKAQRRRLESFKEICPTSMKIAVSDFFLVHFSRFLA